MRTRKHSETVPGTCKQSSQSMYVAAIIITTIISGFIFYHSKSYGMLMICSAARNQTQVGDFRA